MSLQNVSTVSAVFFYIFLTYNPYQLKHAYNRFGFIHALCYCSILQICINTSKKSLSLNTSRITKIFQTTDLNIFESQKLSCSGWRRHQECMRAGLPATLCTTRNAPVILKGCHRKPGLRPACIIEAVMVASAQ